MEILFIADDLTGTLDGAAALVGAGVEVHVRADLPTAASLRTDARVLAVNADTRHVAPSEARERVKRIAAAGNDAGAKIIVKKTDSALRGNVGAELAGMLDAVPAAGPVHFMPAFPEMQRITRDGIQYIDGVPVDKSVFGKDPFEPVTDARVRDIVAAQAPELSIAEIESTAPEEAVDAVLGTADVIVYDIESEDEMLSRCRKALDGPSPSLLAGCAGMTRALALLLGAGAECAALEHVALDEGNLLVFCGSVNDVSTAQCAYARTAGYPTFSLSAESKFDSSWVETEEFKAFKAQVRASWSSHLLTVVESGECLDSESVKGVSHASSSEDVRKLVARNLGRILKRLCDGSCTVFVMGGDVLQSFLDELGVSSISLIEEVATGVVMSEFEYEDSTMRVISKSGGFGEPDLFVSLARRFVSDVAPAEGVKTSQGASDSSTPNEANKARSTKKEKVLVACSSPIA